MKVVSGNRWRWVAALTALAGLVLQMIAVVNHAPGWPRLQVSQAASGLQSVLICTANGPQSITLDADGDPTEAPSEPGDPPSPCPICNVPGSLALASPVEGSAFHAPPASCYALLVLLDEFPAGGVTGIHRNRGPPARSIA